MSEQEQICPVCEQGHLSETTYTGRFEYKGHTIAIRNLEGNLCDLCGEICVMWDQAGRNSKKYDETREYLEGNHGTG